MIFTKISEKYNILNLSSDENFTYLLDLKKDQKIEAEVIVNHTIAEIKSRIKLKAVLRENSSLDLQFIVKIPVFAKSTDTFLSFEILNLSKSSHIRIVPSLEIANNIVKGGHSATIKAINPDEIFFLQSRGLNLKSAKKLIINSFLNDSK